MRLTKDEIDIIKNGFLDFFENGKIYLFGSRVDDTKLGGDIDLYLVPAKKFDDEKKRKRDFSIALDMQLGEQKIDIVVARDAKRSIEQVALRDGIEL
jgi:predicted nucleotidyltransferase